MKIGLGNEILLIDKEDWFRFKELRWQILKPKGYVVCYKKEKTLYLHREILSAPKNLQVDHINGNKLDNQRKNLRLATSQQNLANSKLSKWNTSGFKGARWDKQHKKWKTEIKFNYVYIFIGYFDTLHQAALAYDLWAMDLNKEFAKTNFKVELYGR